VPIEPRGNLLLHRLDLSIPHRPLLQQLVQLQTVGRVHRQPLQPLLDLLRLEALGGTLPFQVVTPQDVPDLVERLRPTPPQPIAQRRLLAILTLRLRGNVHPPRPLDLFAACHPLPVHPQQLAQPIGVPPIGLLPRRLHRLDQDHLPAIRIRVEPLDQPIVEPAHFQQRPISSLPHLGELGEKLLHLGRPGTHLPLELHVARFVSHTHRQLFAMKVDSEV
jgi:hypothetical protein